jgi:hypothetical protein
MHYFFQKRTLATPSLAILWSLSLCTLLTGCSTPSKIDPGFVADRWSTTLRAFNIDPVFLPRQVHLGDIYLAGESALQDESDANRWKRRTMYLGRAAVQQAIVSDTKSRLNLPLTSSDKHSGNIFEAPSTTTALRPVAFPGFNVSEIRDSDFAAAFPLNLFRAVFGASKSGELVMAISIPSAEYEEVPALDAWDKLAEFCWKEDQEPVCAASNPVLRHLFNNLKLPTDTAVLIPKIGIVTSVYYAREINYFYNTGRASAFGASASLALPAPEAQAAAPGKEASVATATGGSTPGDTKADAPPTVSASTEAVALNKRVQDMQMHIDALQKKMEGAEKYGSIRVVSISNAGTTLSQRFESPVAIGYRAIWIFPLGYKPPSSTVLQEGK